MTNQKEEINLKQFYELDREGQKNYVEHLLDIPSSMRSGIQDYILQFFGPKPNNKKYVSMDSL